MPRWGIAISGALDGLGDVARTCEAAGFDDLWVPETSRTAYIQAAVALQATSRVRVGTGIALAFPRSPVITAMEARDLAELSGGRFVLGLGTQVKRVNEARYSTPFEHPAPKMSELMDVCRELWRSFGGEPMQHEGRFYTVTMSPFPGAGPPPAPIGIHLAAVNEGMVGLAGEKADGFLGHPFSSVEYLRDVALPVLHAAADAAGRARTDIEVVQSVICSVGDTYAEAALGARLQIAFYGTTRTYRPVFELHGFGHVVDPLRAAFKAGDTEQMARLITDEMVEIYAVAGTPDECRQKIARYESVADTIVINAPWAHPGARDADTFARLVKTFAPNR